jgi:hypothetical protein
MKKVKAVKITSRITKGNGIEIETSYEVDGPDGKKVTRTRKEVFDYDTFMETNSADLTRGEVYNKKHTLPDGTEVTISGIIIREYHLAICEVEVIDGREVIQEVIRTLD